MSKRETTILNGESKGTQQATAQQKIYKQNRHWAMTNQIFCEDVTLKSGLIKTLHKH